MHRTHKPVRKCHGCGLNLGDRCAVYEYPHDQWHNGRNCPGYKNEAMLREYLEYQAKHPPKEAKVRRQEAQKLRATESHHQGLPIPGRTRPATPRR
ncbi:MAG: hypothetical protein FJ279_18465 [Planctomycetes bacterium]|nr:hypothetical protein [Planctomycetota bacterium]MBM4079847.1 hypothetical protein [Planctomycetota bacterium]MBM4083979.1 hypothetical protein [Planctomycetota bacterium]